MVDITLPRAPDLLLDSKNCLLCTGLRNVALLQYQALFSQGKAQIVSTINKKEVISSYASHLLFHHASHTFLPLLLRLERVLSERL